MKGLDGRVVVVTGGASGVGRGIAEAFAAAGARLALADLHEGRLAETARVLGSRTRVVAQRVDVRDAAALDAFAGRVFAELGAVHVLCNNAGVACNGLLWQHSPADADWILDTNVRSVLHGLRSFLPRMLAAGGPGHVVNTSSMLGLSSAPFTGLYGASKHAVLALSEALRLDLAAVGATQIGVSVLCPGPVRTNVGEEPGRPPLGPEGVPAPVAQMNAALKGVVANGMDPRRVGDCVVDAVRAGRFWVLPAPEFLGQAEQRLAELRSAVGSACLRSAAPR